jgi:hypothetical protein
VYVGAISQNGVYVDPSQDSPVIEQVIPVAGHCASLKQAVPDALQWPCSVGQAASLVQPIPDVEHVPGTIGHSPVL